MGLFDRITNRNKKTENVRIKGVDSDLGIPFNTKTNNSILYSDDNVLSTNELNRFRILKTERNERFNSFDIMCQDSRIASVLNMYADDCTQYNQSSNIIWAESSNPDCANFVNRILDLLQINKHAWTHIYTLCKYGDLYLELFYDNEDIVNDKYVRPLGSVLIDKISMIKNPASLFDLEKQGKSECFVKVNTVNDNFDTVLNKNKITTLNYGQSESDLIYPADKFVHITINDAYSRFSNKFVLKDYEKDEELMFDIKEGNSVLSNIFKVWSELSLLEDSVLLNRLSKSAIIRLIQIEVGNTEDTDVQEILKTLRDKISRSRYLDKTDGTYKNQANPGPLENIIYHATHKGNGVITHSTIGGDVDVKALADIDYFLEKLANGFPVPLAYLKQKNDDGGGLSAGTSITKFDARYGRTLKRHQNAYINGITDLINIFAYKRGMSDYINEFTIKMVSPSAVEENERDEKLKSHMEIIRNIMDTINSTEGSYEADVKKEILSYLIQNLLQDNGLNEILQKDKLNAENKMENQQSEESTKEV